MEEQLWKARFEQYYSNPKVKDGNYNNYSNNRWLKLAADINAGRLHKPTPIPWSRFFFLTMDLDPTAGRKWSFKWIDEIHKIMGEQLTALQEVVVAGDVEAARNQIAQLKQSFTDNDENGQPVPRPMYLVDKSALHYAVTSGLVPMVEMLLDEGYQEAINKNDIITGFTPFHLALFTQNLQMMFLLLRRGARVDIKDNYGATPLDYARLLRFLPDSEDWEVPNVKIKVFDHESKSISQIDVPTFEKMHDVVWCPRWTVTPDYIEELLFSGLQVKKDEEFRRKYMKIIKSSTGDDNIIIAKINDTVGWGAFAARDIKKDEFIIRYGGRVERSKLVKDRSFSMQSGFEGVVLNSKKYRNLAAFINHSERPNVEATCVFHKGVEYAVIIAITDIPKGRQLLMNYEEAYFKKSSKQNYVDMSEGDEFPAALPLN